MPFYIELAEGELDKFTIEEISKLLLDWKFEDVNVSNRKKKINPIKIISLFEVASFIFLQRF